MWLDQPLLHHCTLFQSFPLSLKRTPLTTDKATADTGVTTTDDEIIDVKAMPVSLRHCACSTHLPLARTHTGGFARSRRYNP